VVTIDFNKKPLKEFRGIVYIALLKDVDRHYWRL